MKKLLFLLLFPFCSYAQTVVTLSTADTSKIVRTTGTTNAELILRNSTRSVTNGIAYNSSNGWIKYGIVGYGLVGGSTFRVDTASNAIATKAYVNNFATKAFLSATSPIFYNNSTGVISSQAAGAAANGYVTTGTQTLAGDKTFTGISTFAQILSTGFATTGEANITRATNAGWIRINTSGVSQWLFSGDGSNNLMLGSYDSGGTVLTNWLNINKSSGLITVPGGISGNITGNATTATTATNLSGGSGGTIPYQSAAGTTAMLANGSSGQVLQSNGSTNAPSWLSQSSMSVGTATNATNTAITDDNSTNATMYPTWVTTTTGNLPQKVSSTKMSFNPSTGTLTTLGLKINSPDGTDTYTTAVDNSGNWTLANNTVGTVMSIGDNEVASVAITNSLTVGSQLTVTSSSISGGANNMTIQSGTGASRTMIFKTTTSGSAATTALTLGADQSATFAGAISGTSATLTKSLNINNVFGTDPIPFKINDDSNLGIYLSNENILSFNYGSNATSSGYINLLGYQAGTTQFRNTIIGDGKGNAALTVTGSGRAIKFDAYGAGTLTTDASGNITATSDPSKKRIVGKFTRGLEALNGISPINFYWKPETKLDTLNQYTSFNAKEVIGLIPEAGGKMADGSLTLQDRPIMATMVNGINELAEIAAKQAERIKALETINKGLEKRLSKLEKK